MLYYIMHIMQCNIYIYNDCAIYIRLSIYIISSESFEHHLSLHAGEHGSTAPVSSPELSRSPCSWWLNHQTWGFNMI